MTPARLAKLRAVLDRRQPDLTVVTDHVHKGRNLSAIVRTADAVGIGDVHGVLGDGDYRAFLGTAKGSHRWVEVHRHATIGDALTALRGQGFQLLAAHLDEAAVDFRQIDYTQPTALLLGAEKVGVSAAGTALVDHCITVPMLGMVGSLNVSVAAGIILSEAQRQRLAAGMYDGPRINPALYAERLFSWAHPTLYQFCKSNDVALPPLDEAGELIEPAAWYANVRRELGLQQDTAAIMERE